MHLNPNPTLWKRSKSCALLPINAIFFGKRVLFCSSELICIEIYYADSIVAFRHETRYTYARHQNDDLVHCLMIALVWWTPKRSRQGKSHRARECLLRRCYYWKEKKTIVAFTNHSTHRIFFTVTSTSSGLPLLLLLAVVGEHQNLPGFAIISWPTYWSTQTMTTRFQTSVISST